MRKTVRTTAGIAASVVLGLAALSCGSSTDLKFRTYVANLSPTLEVPAKTTAGTGVVTFVDNGTSIDWTMELTNVTNVTVSHIHAPGAVGVNANPIIFLYTPFNTNTGTLNGIVASGSITNASNVTFSLDSLRTLFNNGMAYVNVHTAVNPGGEIRDQIRPQ